MRITILFSFILLAFAQNCAAQQKIKFKQDTIHFSPLIDGDKIEITYDFKVIGQDKVFIHQIYPGCSCTTPKYSSDTLEPNADGKVIVAFDSKGWGADTGYLVSKHVYVLYNGGSQVVFF